MLVILLIDWAQGDLALLSLLPSPFEHPNQCGRDEVPRSAICDPQYRLKRSEKDIIEGSLNSLAHLGQGAVAIVEKLNRTEALQNETIASATEIVAKATYSSWGIGRGADDRGFLVFLSLGDRTVYISIGAGLEKFVAQDDLTSIITNMKVKLRSGEYSQAILVAVLEIKLLLSLSAEDPLKVWNAGKTDSSNDLQVTSSTSKGSGFFPPDLFQRKQPPPSPSSNGQTKRGKTGKTGMPPPSSVTSADFAKMGRHGARFQGVMGKIQRFGTMSLWIPLIGIAGMGAAHHLEGKLAMQDVVADARTYALDSDDTIVTRIPSRCPHCLNSFALPNATPLPVTGTPIDDIRQSIRTVFGTKETYRTPGCLPCGHVFCVSCMRTFFKRVAIGGIDRGTTDAGSSKTQKTHKRKKRGKGSATAEFCRQCPVCTTTISDWAATLNKIQADNGLGSDLWESASNLDSVTLSRVDSLLARINRNKEISYAASRLRQKYGVSAAIDGGFIYEQEDMEDGWGVYNHRRRRSNDGTTIEVNFGGKTDATRHSGLRSVSGSGSSETDSSDSNTRLTEDGRRSLTPSQEDSRDGDSKDNGSGDTVADSRLDPSSEGVPGEGKKTLAQKLLSSIQRIGAAEEVSGDLSQRRTLAVSGTMGAVGSFPATATVGGRRRDDGTGESVGGSGGEW